MDTNPEDCESTPAAEGCVSGDRIDEALGLGRIDESPRVAMDGIPAPATSSVAGTTASLSDGPQPSAGDAGSVTRRHPPSSAASSLILRSSHHHPPLGSSQSMSRTQAALSEGPMAYTTAILVANLLVCLLLSAAAYWWCCDGPRQKLSKRSTGERKQRQQRKQYAALGTSPPGRRRMGASAKAQAPRPADWRRSAIVAPCKTGSAATATATGACTGHSTAGVGRARAGATFEELGLDD